MTKLACAFLLLAAPVAAQLTITAVINAGSRIPASSPSGGIAQGAVFIVSARGVGPADVEQASFPLPTTDGLAGVTIQATVGGLTVDCIMVYVAPNEVAAILPSQTPLGTGTITVSSNGVSASAPIKVVAAAFGIFTQRQGQVGTAVAFNVSADDGSTAPNSGAQSVQPGQDVMINGTGLGAITSDETQPGVTDVPASTVQVYVGVVPAVVVSAGRGMCCDGLDPAFRIPQGIAAWDVIRFTVPSGVVGCYIPVVVQIGTFVSNLAAISIDPSGAACTPPVPALPPSLTQLPAGKTGVSIGVIDLSRGTGMNLNAAGAVITNKRDTGSAVFVRYDNLPASMVAIDYKYPENVCQINGFPGPNGGPVLNGVEAPIVPLKATALDAGTPLAVSGPAGMRSIVKRTAGMLFDYPGVTFGNSTPGNYYDPGRYTVTGPGGKDVGVFSASAEVPSAPFVWTNIPSVSTPVDRSKDLTMTWTGGAPGTQVTIEAATLANGVATAFLCAASVSAGQLTVPSWVLLNLTANPPPAIGSSLVAINRFVTAFTAPGLDVPSIAFSAGYSISVRFQ